jgi:Concanavalin A-like lectin/glucanases superfamily
MARGFDTTSGSASTDKITTTLTTYPATRSYFAWVYKNVLPAAHTYRIIEQLAGGAGIAWLPNTDGLTYFVAEWSGGQAQWRITSPSTGAWHACGISYDNSSLFNEPVFYLDGTKPSYTEAVVPSGTLNDASGTAILIGNASTNDRAIDGMLAEVAIWDAILTDDEFFALCKGYSPLLIRPASLVEYVPMVRNNVSLRRGAPTISGTAVQPHPRVIGVNPRSSTKRGAAPPPPPETLFAQACL